MIVFATYAISCSKKYILHIKHLVDVPPEWVTISRHVTIHGKKRFSCWTLDLLCREIQMYKPVSCRKTVISLLCVCMMKLFSPLSFIFINIQDIYHALLKNTAGFMMLALSKKAERCTAKHYPRLSFSLSLWRPFGERDADTVSSLGLILSTKGTKCVLLSFSWTGDGNQKKPHTEFEW